MTIARLGVSGCVLAALAVGFLATAPARVAGEPAFFHGKQVRFYTMGSPGGGYDTYMRALIPHLEKKLGRQDAADQRARRRGTDRHQPHAPRASRRISILR